MASLISEEVARVHRALNDAVSVQEAASREVLRLKQLYNSALGEAKASQSQVEALLQQLASRPVTIAVLKKTQASLAPRSLPHTPFKSAIHAAGSLSYPLILSS